MKVHQHVKIKVGKYRGFVGVVAAVFERAGEVVVKLEGIKGGLPFVDEIRISMKNVEVKS